QRAAARRRAGLVAVLLDHRVPVLPVPDLVAHFDGAEACLFAGAGDARGGVLRALELDEDVLDGDVGRLAAELGPLGVGRGEALLRGGLVDLGGGGGAGRRGGGRRLGGRRGGRRVARAGGEERGEDAAEGGLRVHGRRGYQ